MNANENKKSFPSLQKIIDKNAPTALTIISIIGIGATIYLSYRASKKAAKEQEEYEKNLNNIEIEKEDAIKNGKKEEEAEETYKEEKSRAKMKHHVNLVIIYRWVLLTGILSGGAALLSNWLNGRAIVGLAAIVAAGGDKWKIAGKKVKDMIGEDKFKELQESINKEFVGDLETNKKKTPKTEVSSIKNLSDPDEGCKVYWDTYSGTPIEINPSILKDAISRAESVGILDWATWRGYLGLTGPCMMGYDIKWTEDNPFKAHPSWLDAYETGGVNSIVYDNLPTNDRFGK